jgi:cell division GTPase FtsZ
VIILGIHAIVKIHVYMLRPEVGASAAMESIEAIAECVMGADLVCMYCALCHVLYNTVTPAS